MAVGYLPINTANNALAATGQPRTPANAIFNPLGDLAEATAIGGKILAKDLEDNQGREASKDLADLKAHWLQELARRQNDAPAGAPGFADGVAKDFMEDVQARRAKYGAKVRAYFDEHAANFGGVLNTDAFGYEVKARTEQTVRDTGDILDKNRNAVRSNPALHASTYEEGRQLIDNSTLPAQVKSKLQDQWRGQIAYAAVQGLVDKDPYAAQRVLKSGAWDDKLAPEAKDRALALANAEIKHREAEARRAQADARANARIDLDEWRTNANDRIAAGGSADPEEFRRLAKAAGVRDKTIEIGITNIKAGNAAGAAYTDLAGKINFIDMAKTVDEKAQAVAAGDFDATHAATIEAKGYAAALKRHVEEFKADPVAYIRKSSKLVDDAYAAAANEKDPAKAPALWSRALDVATERYNDLGIGPKIKKGEAVPFGLLDKPTLAAIAGPLVGDDPAAIDKIRMQMGDENFQRVYPQLVAAGIPVAAKAQAQINPNTPAGADLKQIAQVAFNPKVAKENADAVKGEERKSFEEALGGAMGQFAKTVPAATSSEAAIELANQTDAVRMLGLHLLVTRRAGSPEAAVKQAYGALIGNNYQFIFGGAARIRNAWEAAGADAEAFLRRELEDTVAKRNFRLPNPGEPGYDDIAKLAPDLARTAYADDLLKKSYWRNNREDTGWELVYSNGIAVKDPSGQPIVRLYGNVPRGFNARQVDLERATNDQVYGGSASAATIEEQRKLRERDKAKGIKRDMLGGRLD